MKLENKVKIARVIHGDLTQQQLADLVECSRQTIHSIEKGKFIPSVALALKLASALKTNVESLFELTEKDPRSSQRAQNKEPQYKDPKDKL